MTYRIITGLFLSLICLPITSLAATEGRHDLRIAFSPISTLNCTTAGFRIYNDNATKICETRDTSSNELTCPDVEVTGDKATFTMTSFCADGRESAHSAPFTLTFPDEDTLKAVITTPVSSGTAPFEVAFNGDNSTGQIVNYHWTFGDGTAAVDGNNVIHHFPAAADYTVTLTISDSTGNKATTQSTISVTGSVTGESADNASPTAVISATSAVGDSPLSVTFDGSESSDPEGSTLTYSWNFGDGSKSDNATPSVTHIYTVAGTYHATLTVSDGTNQTTSSSIPVFVAQGSLATGQPVASISASRTFGAAPLLAHFDGSISAPSSEGDSIIQYQWSFGDGSTASGKIVSHTFTVLGEYTITLTVTDNTGASNTASVSINVQEKNNIKELLPLIYKLLLLNNKHQYTEKL